MYQDFMNCHLPHDLAGSLNTLLVPISRKDCPFKTRFVFAYGVDNSDKPSYFVGCCMEIFVRNTNPDSQLHFVRKFAKDLVVVFAFHLAETISALFRHVLDHPSKVLYDPETEPLFLPIFWFYPIYREMLNSASRHRPSKSMELRRAASGLVKVICRTEESRPGWKGGSLVNRRRKAY